MKHVKMLVMTIAVTVLASAAYLTAYAYPADYDPQYPLKGHLEELGLEFEWDSNTYADYDYATDTYSNPLPTTKYKWDAGHITQDSHFAVDGEEIIRQKTIDENTLKYINKPGGYDEMIAIAILADEPVTRTEGGEGWYFRYATDKNWEDAYILADNLRDFLNTFEDGWYNASEYEKAVHVSKWIRLAKYDTNFNNHSLYNCLIDKCCVCEGYAEAARLLSSLVGLNCVTPIVGDHTFPVFRIDGVWFEYDPAALGSVSFLQTLMFFDIFQPDKYNYYTSIPSELLEGYVVPEDLKLAGYFDDYLIKDIPYADKDHDQGAHRDGLIMVDFCGHFPTDQPYTK